MPATSEYLNRPLRLVEQATVDRVIADNQDAGNWPVSFDPSDEIERQQAIYHAAKNILEATENALIKLAVQSQDHRSVVNADQEDWPIDISGFLEDLTNETFGCLPQAIERARRGS